MKRRRIFLLFILIFLELSSAFRFNRQSEQLVFTAPVYKLSLEENAESSTFAKSRTTSKIGVRLPDKDATCKFRVVEVVGEKASLFKAHARQVGDFVFLRIRYKGDNPLNRELKEKYEMVVKATCKQRDATNLETTTRVELAVADRNDAGPIFDIDAYEATVDDKLEPFSKILQLEASDSDTGMNAALYFSLVNRSHDFVVDPVSGWVRNLRYLKSGVYKSKVRVEDRTSRLFYSEEDEPFTYTADLTITVTETRKKQAKVLVEKKSIDGTKVDQEQLAALITLQDADENTRVGLAEDDFRHWFRIEPSEGKWLLYTTRGHKIPEGANVTLSVGSDVVRGHEVANTTAVIKIEQMAQHEISFDERKIVLAVDEMAAVGRVIRRFVAVKSFSEDRVKYSLIWLDANSTSPFVVSDIGDLRLATPLDFEKDKQYSFEIVAELVGFDDRAVLAVEVNVVDGNDHSPVWAAKWMRQAPVAISDDVKLGNVLLKVDASDRDEGPNGQIGYKLTAEKTSPLRVDINTGEISLGSPLPKGENEWQVSVWAVDWGQPLPRASALNLVFYRNGTKIPSKPKPVISSEPKNSATPVFDAFPDVVEVTEDAPVGTIVAKLSATDTDVGYNGLVRYAAWSDYLDVNETSGELAVVRSFAGLIKEGAKDAILEVKVSAQDCGQPSKRVEKHLKLRVLDVNDHSPVFDQPWYRIRVVEDAKIGFEVLKVTATDMDGGANGEVEYAVASDATHSLVGIDSKTGILRLKQTLDRESADVLRYTVIAMDKGSPRRSSFANVTIEVDDVNDNPPLCVEMSNHARILEDYPDGSLVTCVAARDADLGANAKIRWSLEEAKTVPFRIDHHSGCVFVHAPKQPLDHRRQSFYNLTVEVADNGESSLSTTCRLLIDVVGVPRDRNALEFDDVAKEASVYENSAIGTEVISVNARDGEDKRRVGSIDYLIVDGDGRPYFTIDDKGTIRTSASLDRERQAAYWLTIRATAEARKFAVLHVYVRILDRNDHRPVPRQPVYFANVKENSAANVVVVKVEATDADDVGNADAPPLQYRIERGDPQSFFRVDANSGYVTTSGSRRLDREKQAEHELWIAVCDGGEPSLCSQVAVIVTVDDDNDNAPTFTQPIHHYNVRSNYVGVLCRIYAIDADTGANAELFYNVTEGDERFSVDEKGQISTTMPIHGDESYAFTVQATDRGRPPQMSATRVVLTAVAAKKIEKTKNKPPVISGKKTDYVIPVSDADQVGMTIGKLEASDEDGDDLWWNIVDGNMTDAFDIRRDTGAIMLAKPVGLLPRGEIRLNVSVTDGVAFDHATVIVQVSHALSKRPRFSASHYQTQISEKTSVGTQIFTLKAIGEEGTKPLVYSIFSIEDVSAEDKIRVEPSTGNVLVMESLDSELTKQIRAVVAVRQANLINFATFIVDVGDENDNAPRFAMKKMTAFVGHDDEIDSIVAKTLAYDADDGVNGLVNYSIVSGNERGYFALDAASGELTLVKKIDWEDNVEAIVTIRASDGGKYPLSDTCVVHVKIDDSPHKQDFRFERKQYLTSVRDATRPGTPVVVVAAPHHGLVIYSLKQPCPYFDIHAFSGTVSIAKWLTRERARSLSCVVVGETVNGNKDESKVVVKLIATNQHAPVFKQQVYRATIRENSPTGTAVTIGDGSPLVVAAVDLDVGPNALLGYRLLVPADPFFAVDFVSGAIRSRKPIDFEKTKEWSFYVQAVDMGQPARSSPLPALVVVSIIDENDGSPKFADSSLEIPLLLPSANGVIVAHQSASDSDTVGRLRYYIKNIEALKLFSINSTTGAISVFNSKSLVAVDVVFDVFVSDGVRSASYKLKVVVKSTSLPGSTGLRFPQKEYAASIIENTTYVFGKTIVAVTAIGATDGTPVVYSILNERPEFFIHSGTGVVAATGVAVDREEEPIIRLVVQASTHGVSSELAQTVVSVRVDDVNDCIPTFIGVPYDVIVAVEADVGERVISVRAVDKDSGLFGRVTYSSKDLPDIFKLNKSDGKITVAKKLDKTGIVEFNVVAEDQGKPPLTSTERVRISIVDKAQPVFTQQIYNANVAQGAKKGTTVIKVKAKSNIDGVVGYRIGGVDDDVRQRFVIDWATGDIKLARTMTLIGGNTTSELTVEAVDATRPKAIGSAKVVVKVSVPYRAAPVFSSPTYEVRLVESAPVGQSVVDVAATCAGDDVTYALQGINSTVFSIDADTGEVTLAKSLDFETIQRYDLTIVASTRAQVSSEAALTVFVDDVNDTPPKFLSPFSSAHVVDSAVAGQFITILSVTDDDSVASLPDDSKMLFSVVDGDETLFDIDDSTGQVTLARAVEDDDVVEPIKRLNVSLTDGIFTAYGQLTVEIKQSGRRQPPPRFEQSQYVVSAFENTPLSNKTALLTVLAKEGIPPLRYSLGSIGGREKGTWPIRIDRNTGRIHAARLLDYHSENLFTIPLVAEDSLGRRAFASLTLFVLDRNDSPPKFVLSKYTASVSAAAKEGDTVLMLSASDDDANDDVEYSLVGDDVQVFAVHPKQGTLTVAKKIDGKVGQTLSLLVKATDSANPPHHATCDVEIQVVSETTSVPRFSHSHYVFDVAEDAVVGHVIGRVQQVEDDVDQVRFTIADSPGDLPFSVERSKGKLIVRAALDRERRAQWRFAVRADAVGGVHAMTTVTVDVGDVNDNAPAFHGDYDRLSILEDSAIGTSVAIFSATDKDRAPAGRITFSLLDSLPTFKMDSETGWLTVGSPLDREKQDKYQLTARATDEGGLNTDVKFSVEVTDVNDSPPVFDKKSYEVDVDQTTLSIGTVVARVVVRDADLPPHNESRLFISRGNDVGVFAIDSEGVVTIRRANVAPARYELTILAFDGVFATAAKLVVNVKSATEFVCPTEAVLIDVKENAKKGSVVANLTLAGATKYALIAEGKDVPFVANSANGIVTLDAKLDFETVDQYSFSIESASSSSKCVRRIVVSVLDVNDNSPVFEQKEYSATINENIEADDERRVFVVRVVANDADSPQFGTISYTLSDGFDVFVIDSDSGVVAAVRTLDRETRSEYTLHVLASDNDPTRPKTAKAVVKISVADQNDNAPVFEKKIYSLQVMESESIGYELLKVRAEGGDEGETVRYNLRPTDDNKFVKLDDLTGSLTLAEGLDFEKKKTLSLIVEATDSGTPPMASTATIEVTVLDENDNAPVFDKPKYKATVKENSKIGTRVLMVKATDADSEHLGRVGYSIVDDIDRKFNIDADGWIVVASEIDYEKTTSYTLTIEAKDGGQPAQTSRVDVVVDVVDENDNAPDMGDCNMTAVVQEGVAPGHVVLTVNVKDPDGKGNAEPFKLEVKGEGSKSFKFDENMNLVTATKLQHAKKERFLLTVIARDAGGKSSDCPLTVFVKEESRHAPTMRPTKIDIVTVMGEMKAGKIGLLKAADRDSEDMLRYAIVEGSIRGPLPTEDVPRPNSDSSPHDFRVDSITGEIWSDHSLAAGLHAFNVSVTDGKFSTVSYVEVTSSAVDRDVLDHAVAIRIRDVTINDFFAKHDKKFRNVLATHLNVPANRIRLLSVQQVASESSRAKRAARKDERTDVEILLTAQRGQGRGLLKPDHIYSRLKLDFETIQDQSNGLRYQLTTEMCTTGVCKRGECRERVDLLDDSMTFVAVDGTAYVGPHHSRVAECLCPEGFGGKHCEFETNECARSPCEPWQVCVPTEGRKYECSCPLGMTGARCDSPACDSDAKCLEEAELSVGGEGYFEMSLANEVETRMELEVELKTSAREGVVMWGSDGNDYHRLQLVDGFVEYTWDCGSGSGVVRSKVVVADGKWHRVAVSRRQRRTRVVIDDGEPSEAFSPTGSTVINLHSFAQKLVFGAQLEIGSDGTRNVSHGVAACFRGISLDGRKVAKTRQGLRLFAAAPGCGAMSTSPCADAPCDNGGRCVVNGRSFTCLCAARFSGDRCEVDTEPCTSNPCPLGIQCIPFYNDYLCKCPNGFTGKRCEMRGFAESESSCSTDKCGIGQCIAIPRSNPESSDFICNCTGGILQSTPCHESSTISIMALLSRFDVQMLLAGIVLVFLLICCICIICRRCRRERDPKYGTHVDDASHMRNHRVFMPVVNPPEIPPPLPPRGNRIEVVDRQVALVPPFSNAVPSRFDSRSPSLAGSGKSASTRRRDIIDFEKNRVASNDLRRYGHRIPATDSDSCGSGTVGMSNRVRMTDRRLERHANGALSSLQYDRDLGDSIQCLPHGDDDWRQSSEDALGIAIRTKMANARVHVGNTVLTPVMNDDDYMTMRPRTRDDMHKSMPLLDQEERDDDASTSSSSSDSPPPPPQHAPPPPACTSSSQMQTSGLYDEPMSSSNRDVICDIDASDDDV